MLIVLAIIGCGIGYLRARLKMRRDRQDTGEPLGVVPGDDSKKG